MRDIVIIGGGLAGLVNAVMLSRAGLDVLLIEKKDYPHHKVCGEYVSNEVLPFLKSHGLFPEERGPAAISRFMLTSVSGGSSLMPLDLGAFGISRYAFDDFLYHKAQEAGTDFLLNTAVREVEFKDDHFLLSLPHNKALQARLVIGAYGKRSRLDKQLDRPFARERSPYIGVKYHLRTDFPDDLIALHNFRGGYCGISRVEDGRTNLCYLGSRSSLRQYGSIEEMEQAVVYENPYLRDIFMQAEFLFEKPEVINEVSFAPKQPVENHILMSGDTAGLITPLCGNGMAMAIHSAKLLSELIIQYYRPEGFRRSVLEEAYRQQWQQAFAQRLWVGRKVQRLFGSAWLSEAGVGMVRNIRPLARWIMRNTHGRYI
ncbi:MAG: NAD(P)/FAD-dependent oxidoreductase [Cyclobacteriaceae bacterium]